MWPLIVAFGVYVVCKGVQQGIEENAQYLQLPPRYDELSNYEIYVNEEPGDEEAK